MDGSADALPVDLQRAGLLGRFPPQTERRYGAWLVTQIKPLVRIVLAVSITIWVPMPFLVDAWVSTPIEDEDFLYVMSWAIAVPILSLGLVLSYWVRDALQIPIASACMLAFAVPAFYMLYEFMPVPHEAGLVGGVVWLSTLIPFARIPFRTTLVLVALITGVGSAFLIAAIDELGIPSAETWPDFLLILFVILTVPLMSLVGEQTLRQNFVDEQIIARQQAELVASRALIRRYAPPAVADRLEHGDATVGNAQRRRVTIFFADVVGFTAMADRLDPEALAEVMNDYLGAVAEIVERHGGTLNEFAGDGVMAIFGAPDDMDPVDQVQGALNAARELQRSLPQWSQHWYTLGIDQDLRARIGINTGVVSIGTFGSAGRATYTGIGLQTNIGARIQAQCPPGSVLLSTTSWHLVRDIAPCTLRGEVEVKGVHFPIAMYEPDVL